MKRWSIIVGEIAIMTIYLVQPVFSQARVNQPRQEKVSGKRSALAVEQSYLAGLRWLQQKQRADGSWDGDGHDVEATALALLAFDGHAESPESTEFGQCVERAERFLRVQLRESRWREKPPCTQAIVALAVTQLTEGLSRPL